MKTTQYQTGVDGEQLAEQWLNARGLITAARRYRGGDGEIDLIMRDGDVLAFV